VSEGERGEAGWTCAGASTDFQTGDFSGAQQKRSLERRRLRHGFEQMGLNRIEALVYPENAASLRVLERRGFPQEGLLRQSICQAAVYYDHWLLALPKLVAAFALAARTPWVLDHDVALATDFERSLLDFKSSALGHAVLRDEGMPAELQAIAPQPRSLLERV